MAKTLLRDSFTEKKSTATEGMLAEPAPGNDEPIGDLIKQLHPYLKDAASDLSIPGEKTIARLIQQLQLPE